MPCPPPKVIKKESTIADEEKGESGIEVIEISDSEFGIYFYYLFHL